MDKMARKYPNNIQPRKWKKTGNSRGVKKVVWSKYYYNSVLLSHEGFSEKISYFFISLF